jgi:propanol-preferring alcohol dehydrogenase
MHGMVLTENAPIEASPLIWRELPDPQPGPGEVRLHVRCCAICRTDLHVIEGDLPPARLPVVPGHQIVGVVESLGEGCRSLKIGQRVGIAWLRHTCGRCAFCRTGRENLCESARFTGYHADGGYAELAVVAEEFAYPLPEEFSDAEATPLLCAGIIGYRALLRSELPPGGKLGIFGFGSSAHIVIQLAQYRGSETYVVTRGEGHRALARAMGAAWVGENAADMPCRVESAIVFAPSGRLVPQALTALQKGGSLALAGIYMTPIPELDYERHLFFERNIHSVTANTREDGHKLLAEAAQAKIHPHITTFPLQRANEALQRLKADQIDGTGVLTVAR